MHKRRIASTFALSGIGEVINKITPFLIYALAMQRLGVSEFGQAQLAMSVFEVIIPWILLATHQVGMIEAGQQFSAGQTKSNVMLPLTVGRLGLGFLAMVGLLIFTWINPPTLSYQKMLPLLAPMFLLLANEAACVMIGAQKVRLFSIIQSSMRLLSLVAIVLLVHSPNDSFVFVAITLGCTGIIGFVTLLWSIRFDQWRWSGWSYFQSLWKRSFIFGLPLMVLAFQDRIDLFLAQRSLSEHLTGLYAAPMRLTQSFINIIGPLALVFFSEMLRNKDRESISQHARLAIRVLVMITMPLAVGGYFVGAELLTFVFGTEAIAGLPALRILLWQPFFYSFVVVFGLHIGLLKDEVVRLTGSLVLGVAATFVVYILFADHQSLVTIAGSSLFGRFIAVVGIAALAARHVNIVLWRDLASPAFACLVMALVLKSFATGNLLIDLLIGASAFAVVLGWMERTWLIQTMRFLKKSRTDLKE